MTERERMLAGKLYKSVGNQELHSLKEKKDVIIAKFNDTDVNFKGQTKNTKEMDWAAYLTSLPFKAQERFIR